MALEAGQGRAGKDGRGGKELGPCEYAFEKPGLSNFSLVARVPVQTGRIALIVPL